MYQIDSSKRYNVTSTTANYGEKYYNNVQLVTVAPNFVVLRCKGEDVIITGGTEVTIEEI